ncbi:MAG: GNAT family N-acetyltransferase [Lachnospiraceae bacterium]|nr:GNAT family N-acetyltransferase [Lachnospiraceae bacterium]
MEIGWIDREMSGIFQTLLLPEAAEALKQRKPLLALGLTEDDVACGAATGELQGDVFTVTSFYVAPDYRRRGGGTMLIEALRNLLKEHCHSLEISYTVTLPEHQALAPFLTAMGFLCRPDYGETIYGVTLGSLENNSFFAREQKIPANVRPFAQVSPTMLREVYQAARVREEAYLPVPLTDSSLDAAVSMAVVEDNSVRSFAAVLGRQPGLLELAWVQSGRPQDMAPMLLAAYAAARRSYPPETLLTVQAVNAASAKLLCAMLPEADPISFTYYCDL